MRKVRKRVRGEKEKETNRERRKRVVECIIEEENRQNRVLDDLACQFYIVENERERGKDKKNQVKKEIGQKRGGTSEEKCRKAKRNENHMLNECACRLYAQLEIRLQVQTNTRNGYEEEQEISYPCEYFAK